MHRRTLLAAGLTLPFAHGCSQAADVLPPPAPTQGLNAAVMDRVAASAEALPKLHAMIVARDGQRLFERTWRGPSLETPVNIKSASKSVIAALGGIAIGQGVFQGVEQPISAFLADRFPTTPDPRLTEVTIGPAVDAGRPGVHLGGELRRLGLQP